jgi:hypothetical protein
MKVLKILYNKSCINQQSGVKMKKLKSIGDKLSEHQRYQLIKAAQLTGSRIIADGKVIYVGTESAAGVTAAKNLYSRKGIIFEKKLDGIFKKIIIKDYERSGWITVKEINLEVLVE